MNELADEGGKLIWSQNPGCFERHLQRKYNNPFFPSETLFISQSQIDEARYRDEKEAAEVRSILHALADRVINGEKIVKASQGLDLLKSLDILLSRVSEIGGPLNDYAPKIFDFYLAVTKDVSKAFANYKDIQMKFIQCVSLLAYSRRLYDCPFIAQMRRADSPIKTEEIVRSLLCENVSTIELMVETLSEDPIALKALRDSTEQLMRSSPSIRDVLLGQPKKITALGIDFKC